MIISTYKEALQALRRIDELVQENAAVYMLSSESTAQNLATYAGFSNQGLDLVKQYILERIPTIAKQQKSSLCGEEGSFSTYIFALLDFEKQKEYFLKNRDTFDECAAKLKRYYRKKK